MITGRPDYAAIDAWPLHRPHLVRDVATGDIIEVKGTHDRGVDLAIEEGRLEPIIPADEPVFLIRATDMAGPSAVRAYASTAQLAGADPALIRQVLEQADRMEDYARIKAEGGKTPDLATGIPPWPARSTTDDPGRDT